MATTKDKIEFAFHMARHTRATPAQIQRLLRYGATLNRLATEQCNREWTERDERKRERIQKAVYSILYTEIKDCEPVFSNDPRGACLKIRVPDGFTTDWGREGISVPTS